MRNVFEAVSILAILSSAQLAVAQSGRPEQLGPEKFVQRAVWVPYWSEQGDEHSTLHLRNALHHSSLWVTVDVFASTGDLIKTYPTLLDRVSNIDLRLVAFVPSNAPPAARSGSIRITFNYPHEGVLQAELSVRNDKRNQAFTFVGRPSYGSDTRAAYLAVHVPTRDTYLQMAFVNPTRTDVNIQLSIRESRGWKSVGSLSLTSNANGKVRIAGEVLNNPEFLSSTSVVVVRAEYSAASTEIVSNAWLADDISGFSNTALLHDEFPKTNTLFGTQLVSGSLPEAILAQSPTFDSWLVFVNLNDTPAEVSGRVSCQSGGVANEVAVGPLSLLPFSPQTISIESIVGAKDARSAMCGGKFEYTGAAGRVLGRFYGVSRSKTYGVYSKLEPWVGYGYNEVYWTTEEDVAPILTVTNFGSDQDVLTIYASHGGSLLEVLSQPVRALDSITVNLRDALAALRSKSAFNSNYGGLFVSSATRRGKLLVKQQAISAKRHTMVPYYGSPPYVTSHGWNFYPTSLLPGTQDYASVHTCYSSTGCFEDDWYIYSGNSAVVTTNTTHPPRRKHSRDRRRSWDNHSRLHSLLPNRRIQLRTSPTGPCDDEGDR